MSKKRVLALVLCLALVFTMVFGLTACAPEPSSEFYYKTIGGEVTNESVLISDFAENATIYDVLSKEGTKYNFNADITGESPMHFLNKIEGKGLVPDTSKGEFVSTYSTVVPAADAEDWQKVAVNVDGKDFYPTMGIDAMILKEDVDFLFVVMVFS